MRMYGSCNVLILLPEFPKIALLSVVLLWSGCDADNHNKQHRPSAAPQYLNLSDSARYVGMQTCRNCHQSVYDTYIRTGMGSSFGLATRQKSAADYTDATIFDKHSNLYYHAGWENDSLYITEFRLEKKDTTHSRKEKVNYVIGSGQHTNSHLRAENGYLYQMPMTFYTQKGHWDLPPGFENGVNTRFGRKIGLECISCHNAFPDFVKGSENKFHAVPGGIDCERCHGPGSVHVQQRMSSPPVDTSKYIDYSIVNPAKLPVERQFDICQRCHLQGNAVLTEGSSFFEFRPGQKLSDHINVFMPRYSGAEDEFIMASHAERLKMSPCFISSISKADTAALRPYKNALTCVTCHNPHVSVKETSIDVFNQACNSCHGNRQKLEAVHGSAKSWNDCVSCHMPRSGSTDIPHVTVHDHFIRKPVTKKAHDEIRKFLGLYAVNNSNPDKITRARAYLDQYEKFSQDSYLLDSAEYILLSDPEMTGGTHALIQLYFVRNEYQRVLRIVQNKGEDHCLSKLFVNSSFDNRDAWATYRVAESFSRTGNAKKAALWFRKAVSLAPYNLDYRNKLGTSLAALQDIEGASEQFGFILKEDPTFVSVYANLGYLKLLLNQLHEAKRLLLIGKELDPDNEPLLLNLATCYLQMGDRREAVSVLEHILKNNPRHSGAANALRELKNRNG